MIDPSKLARLRDFCLVAVGTVALFLAALLLFARLRFPGLVQSNLGGAYWVYLALSVGVTVCCAVLYAWFAPHLSKGGPGV